MAGIEALAGGRVAYVPQDNAQQLASAIANAEMAQMPVMQQPVQQQGVPMYANNAPMPGAMAAWENYGIPPVMYHPNSPLTTLAYRVTRDPYGQMGVQPLVGFGSVYPHVLPGVPNNPFQTMFPLLQAMMPPMVPLQWGAAQQPRRGSGGVQRQTPPNGTRPPAQPPATPPAAPRVQPVPYMGDERARANSFPVEQPPAVPYTGVPVPYDNGMTTTGGMFIAPEDNPVVSWRDDLKSLWDLITSPWTSSAANVAAGAAALAPGEVRPELFPPTQ